MELGTETTGPRTEGPGPRMRINQNIAALSAYRALSNNQSGAAVATERLSSGLRINRAADDAAGLAISETMRGQVNGLNQGQRNAGDGISLLRTAEGSLNETHAILQRMRTLAVRAANTGVMTSDNLAMIQTEMTQLTADIDRIAYKTEFNGAPLLDGTFRDKKLQVGANAGDTKTVDIMSGITPAVPARPPIPAEPAGVALWEVGDPARMSAISDPVSFTHTVGGQTATVDVPMPAPLPTSVTELVDRLNADPGFSQAFVASPGTHVHADGSVTIPNLIVMATGPGAGDVSVTGIPNDTSQLEKDPGHDEIPGAPEIPARYGGYGSVDILGAAIDVTREAGSSTTTIKVGGTPTRGFGHANDIVTPEGDHDHEHLGVRRLGRDRPDRPSHRHRQPGPCADGCHRERPGSHDPLGRGLGREPRALREPHPRRRHGQGDHRVEAMGDPHPGLDADARAGQCRAADGAQTAAVTCVEAAWHDLAVLRAATDSGDRLRCGLAGRSVPWGRAASPPRH